MLESILYWLRFGIVILFYVFIDYCIISDLIDKHRIEKERKKR